MKESQEVVESDYCESDEEEEEEEITPSMTFFYNHFSLSTK